MIDKNRNTFAPGYPFVLNRESPQARGLLAWFPMTNSPSLSMQEMTGRWGLLSGVAEPATGGQSGFIDEQPAWLPSNNATGTPIFINLPDFFGGSFSNASVTMWIRRLPVTESGYPFHLTAQAFTYSHYPLSGSGSGTCYSNTLRSSSRESAYMSNLTHPHRLTITTTPGANGWKLYQNTTVIMQASGDSSMSLTSERYIGCSYSLHTFPGYIADFRVYDRTLSEAEVWALCDQQSKYDLYYRLNERTWFIPPVVAAGSGNRSQIIIAG